MGNTQGVLDPDSVRLVNPDEYKAAALCLAEAFANDDTTRYFLDMDDTHHLTDEQNRALHVAFCETLIHAKLLKGVVTTVGEDYDCVALWMPPNTQMDDTLTFLRSSFWRFTLITAKRHQSFKTPFPLLHQTKAGVLGARDNDSYYLVYIGTKEASRGQGLATKMVANVARRADKEARAMDLEKSHGSKVGFYAKMGFEIKKKIVLDDGRIELDALVRTRGPDSCG